MLETDCHRHIQSSVVEALRQGDCLLEALDDDAYNARLPDAFDASIGGHYRHCLEHFEALLGTAPGGCVDYDARARDEKLETDRAAALARTRDLAASFARLEAAALAESVTARCKISYIAEGSPTAPSTLGREAMYAVAHAIHHYALIGVMCRLLSIDLPRGFGVAPSTAHHRRETSIRRA